MLSRRRFLEIAGTTAAGVATTSCGGRSADAPEPPPLTPPVPPPSTAGSLQSIEHIIFTMQENRSFDHYFGRLPQYRLAKGIPGEVDGLPANASNPARDDAAQLVKSFHIETVRHENLTPSWNHSHRQRNRNNPSSDTATLDGFVYSAAQYSRDEAAAGRDACDMDGTRAMGYYDERDLPYYYELFSQFPISDRHFCSVMSATVPNRMYLLSGSSHGFIRPLRAGDTQVNAPTIFELLEEKGITWKIYLNQSGPKPFSFYQLFTGSQRNKAKVVNAEEFFIDAQNGTLPQVAMVESGVDTGLDEHPLNRIDKGSAYIRRVFNALMASPLWTKSAMLLTFDEAGGFYDHVAPPNAVAPDDTPPKLLLGDTPGSFSRLSFRVPLVLVSPWAKKHYVGHTVTDFTAILKLIERRFGLANLTRRDAAAHDLTDMFDFSRMAFETPPALPLQPENLAQDFCDI